MDELEIERPRERERKRKGSPWGAIFAFLGGIFSAAGAVILSIAYEELRAPSEASLAAEEIAQTLEPRADEYHRLADGLRIRARTVANTMLFARPALDARTEFDAFGRDWGAYQTVYVDLLRVIQTRGPGPRPPALLGVYLRRSVSATKRVNDCLEAATTAYRPSAAAAMAELADADLIPASLTCRTGEGDFMLNAEIALVDECNTALRRGFNEAVDTVRNQADDSLLATARRVVRRGLDRAPEGAGVSAGEAAEIAARLELACPAELKSARRPSEGVVYPWQDFAQIAEARRIKAERAAA